MTCIVLAKPTNQSLENLQEYAKNVAYSMNMSSSVIVKAESMHSTVFSSMENDLAPYENNHEKFSAVPMKLEVLGLHRKIVVIVFEEGQLNERNAAFVAATETVPFFEYKPHIALFMTDTLTENQIQAMNNVQMPDFDVEFDREVVSKLKSNFYAKK